MEPFSLRHYSWEKGACTVRILGADCPNLLDLVIGSFIHSQSHFAAYTFFLFLHLSHFSYNKIKRFSLLKYNSWKEVRNLIRFFILQFILHFLELLSGRAWTLPQVHKKFLLWKKKTKNKNFSPNTVRLKWQNELLNS